MKQVHADRERALAQRHYSRLDLPAGDLWIFGYGSLMWNPGIPFARWAPARVFGYHRSLCISSSRWRGTPDRPGLVLGLDRGGCCRGVAFHIEQARVASVLEALWEREMRSGVYEPRLVRAQLPDRETRVLTFIADPHHTGYAGKLPDARMAKRIATCRGDRGPNLEYVRRTVDYLAELGMRDQTLQRILTLARGICAGGSAGARA